MQTINKTSANKTFAHTWYVYPIVATLITLLWIWGFQAFHQPSNHQKLTLFFATEIKNKSFLNDIRDNYDREKLRQVEANYGLPTSVGFTTKLQVAVNTADIIILDETTLASFNDHHQNYFVEIDNYVKSYLEKDETYYVDNEKNYGILLKEKNTNHWMKQYMDFDEEKDYYITISIASQNIGKVFDENNAYYDNALSIIKYLIKEN